MACALCWCFALARRARPRGTEQAFASAGREPGPRCSAVNGTAGPGLVFARIYLGIILTIPGGGGNLELL